MNVTANKINIKSQPKGIVMPVSKPLGAKKIGIITVIVLILCAALSLVIYFDVGGIKRFFSFSQMAIKTVENDIRVELENEKRRINEESQLLAKLKSELEKKETVLREKETQIEEAISQVNSLKEQLEGSFADIKSISDIYEKMEAADAAEIISNYRDKKMVVGILKNMSKAKVAEILSNMDRGAAAQLLQMLSQ